MEVERRFGKREPVNMSARIILEAGASVEATVRDYSHLGCRLATIGSARIPQQFTLHYCEGQMPDVKVEKVWQQGDEVGVRFLTEHERPVSRRPLNADIRRLSVTDLRAMTRRPAG